MIVMMHQGSIVEVGTHEQLMNLQGRYFALYRQQEADKMNKQIFINHCRNLLSKFNLNKFSPAKITHFQELF